MRRRTFPISLCLSVSALGLAASCGPRESADPAVEFLPAPPADVASDQRTDAVAPQMPPAAAESEALYETWVSDRFDWGDRRNLLAWRWCQSYNRYAPPIAKTDCGPKPEGVE